MNRKINFENVSIFFNAWEYYREIRINEFLIIAVYKLNNTYKVYNHYKLFTEERSELSIIFSEYKEMKLYVINSILKLL